MQPRKHRARYYCLCVFLWLSIIVSLEAETVRVATYNLHNYLNMDRWSEGHWRKDYPKPEREKQALREIIQRIQPDILALQEVGSAAYLAELQADLRAEGLDYPYAELLPRPDDDRQLALLSKLPPVQVLSHDGIAFRYFDKTVQVKRGLQEAVFDINGLRWSLFNLHLKSRWTDREDDLNSVKRRVGEATAIRNYIRHQHPVEDGSPRYLVAGDFNDTRESATLRRFLEVGGEPLMRLVECTDSRGEVWTFRYRKRDVYERVDFILSSPSLGSYIRGGAGTIVDILPEANIASDHRMVYVDLDFPERGPQEP